jgi:hypothetical protein
MNLYQKLIKIQEHVMGLKKNKRGNNYEYVTGEKVLEHIKPMMNQYGILLKQEILSIENTRQDYATRNGNKSEINSKVMMRFTWVDSETGEKDENLFGANGQNDWDKGVGSALTYGERYFLLKYFHIATDEDDIDNIDRKPQEQSAPIEPKAKSEFTLDELKKKLSECATVEALTPLYQSLGTMTPAIIDLFANRKKEILAAK